MAGLGRQIGRLEIMIERCLKATVGGEWGTKRGRSVCLLTTTAAFSGGSIQLWWRFPVHSNSQKRSPDPAPTGRLFVPSPIRPAEMKGAMRKVSEYASHAAECRRLADQMSNPEHKKQLIQMAETWEMLAIARVKQLSRKKSKGDV